MSDEDLKLERVAMAAHAGPSGQDDDGVLEEGEAGEAGEAEDEGGEASFPDPPERAAYLTDLLDAVGEGEMADAMRKGGFGEVGVHGVQTEAEHVIYGDLFVLRAALIDLDEDADDEEGKPRDPGEAEMLAAGEASIVRANVLEFMAAAAQAAVEAGASAIISQVQLEGVPEDVPVIVTDAPEELGALLATAIYDTPSSSMRTVAVCGTDGKSTVAWLVREMLEEAQQLTGLVSTIEYALADERLDDQGRIWRPDEPDPSEQRECAAPFVLCPFKGRYTVEDTTPDAINMQRVLAAMRDRGATAAVVECTTDALAMQSGWLVDVSVAVHTNFGPNPYQDHVFDGDPKQALAAQLSLFASLEDPARQRGVINLDDPAAPAVKAAAAAVPCITYSINDSSADVWAESMTFSIWETQMLIRTPVGRLEIITPLLGRHNVSNVLAAVATGVVLNVPLETIVAGIEAVDAVPGRSEVIDEGAPFSVVVDAADSPQRLAAMLDSLREAGARRVWAVMGCEGERAGATRAEIGQILHEKADAVILTNSSPRGEDPSAIINAIVAGFPKEMLDKYGFMAYFPLQDQHNVPLWFEPHLQMAQRSARRYVMEDRFSAIRAAIGTAAADDVVLIAGRGHLDYVDHWDGESGQLRGWLDDRVEARCALSRLRYLNALPHLQRATLPWGSALDDKVPLIS